MKHLRRTHCFAALALTAALGGVAGPHARSSDRR